MKNATSRARPKKAEINAATSSEQRGSAWVDSMHDHFQRTGYYRANDLNRLLGDPRDTVGVTLNDGVKVHSLAAK